MGCFCLGSRPPASPDAESVTVKAARAVPMKHRNQPFAAGDSEKAEPLIAAVKGADDSEVTVSKADKRQQQQQQQGSKADPIASEDGVQPQRDGLQAAARESAGGSPVYAAAAEPANEPALGSATEPPSEFVGGEEDNAEAHAAVKDEAVVNTDSTTADASGGDSWHPAASQDMPSQPAASSNPLLPADASVSQVMDATDGTAAAEGAGSAGATQQDQPPAVDSSLQLPAAEDASRGPSLTDSGRSRSSIQEPPEESSQAALLGGAEVSLKQQRLSQLSSFFSCGSGKAGGDSGERITPKQQPTLSAEAAPPQLDFTAAAAELVLLPRSKLLPLAQPEHALADAAGMLGRQDVPTLLTALLTLRRVGIHHPQLLAESLEDVMALLMECLHGGDSAVAHAAVMALLDLLMSFGTQLLRHCENREVPHYSCLLGLLLAASCGRTPAIRYWANEALRFMAERLHQARVIRMLEPYLEHPQPLVRSKAAEWLMHCTYRPPDSSTSPRSQPRSLHRPASPPLKWKK